MPRLVALLLGLGVAVVTLAADPPGVTETVVTGDLTLPKGAKLSARLVVTASNVVIDGNGATLTGPGTVGDAKALAAAGVGVRVVGGANVVIKNLSVKGFATGLEATDAQALSVAGCDFSDNYTNPGHDWGELPARGGVVLARCTHATLTKVKANRVWDGLHLVDSDDNLVHECDFSHCSNTCLKLWHSSRNRVLNNNLSYGIRIDRAKGETHARDSTGVLMETGSDDNILYKNDVTHGGDGIFVRVLNGWVSRGNVFTENDCSYANNNCVESWSPGNTYVRNTANHGSYGFWLGGSDDTRLIGNEAAYNGLAAGYHNAPEPGFGHGGIVCVNGPGSHCVLDGNHCHHNNGGGIVFRGDLASKGVKWRIRHWVVQHNKLHDNSWGVYGQYATDVVLAGNSSEKNAKPDLYDDVTDRRELPAGTAGVAPVAQLAGPTRVVAGKPVRFDAAGSTDPAGGKLAFRWDVAGAARAGSSVAHTFPRPGAYRVALTADNGGRAGLAFRDVLVADPAAAELGTENHAGDWGATFGDDPANTGRLVAADDPDAVHGAACVRLRADPYPGGAFTAVYPKDKSAAWDWSKAGTLAVWVKYRNPNLPGWQGAGPAVTLYGPAGERVLTPAKGKNLLAAGESESRAGWQYLEVPLAGGPGWDKADRGAFALGRVTAVGFTVDSYGADPFTLWLDGLCLK